MHATKFIKLLTVTSKEKFLPSNNKKIIKDRKETTHIIKPNALEESASSIYRILPGFTEICRSEKYMKDQTNFVGITIIIITHSRKYFRNCT